MELQEITEIRANRNGLDSFEVATKIKGQMLQRALIAIDHRSFRSATLILCRFHRATDRAAAKKFLDDHKKEILVPILTCVKDDDWKQIVELLSLLDTMKEIVDWPEVETINASMRRGK